MTDQFPVPSNTEIDELTDQIRLALRGKGPLLQGAALCDIVSMFFAGHNPELREDVITKWVETMRQMILLNEAELMRHYGSDPWAVP